MSEVTKTQSIEQTPGNSTPEDKGGQGEKVFTQEDVNRIVQERLAKERAKNETPSAKEQELAAREARLTCREYLLETGGASVLLDVLDTSDPEKFKAAAEKLREAGFSSPNQAGASRSTSTGGRIRTGMSHQGGYAGVDPESQIADAFKPKRR